MIILDDRKLIETKFQNEQEIEDRQFNNEVQHLGEQKGCYLKCVWENDIII